MRPSDTRAHLAAARYAGAMGNRSIINRFTPWPQQCRYCTQFRGMSKEGFAHCARLGREYLCPDSGCEHFRRETGSDDDLGEKRDQAASPKN
jgi:hypothetical protein